MTTKGPAAMWAKWRATFAALGALWLFAGCGKAMTTESGETHFVSCDTDADCVDVSGAHSCSAGKCRGPANTSGTAGNSSSGTPTPACASGCGDSECAAPGSCSLESACAVVDCGSAIVDDNACVRPACTGDADCPEDERCTSIYLGRHYECAQTGSTCECTAGHGLFPLDICSPVAVVGRRGEWAAIWIGQTFEDRGETHTFYADGAFKAGISAEGTPLRSGQISGEDLDQLNLTINGPTLRPRVAPFDTLPDCVVGVVIGFDPDFNDAVGACFGPDDSAINTLLTLAQRY